VFQEELFDLYHIMCYPIHRSPPIFYERNEMTSSSNSVYESIAKEIERCGRQHQHGRPYKVRLGWAIRRRLNRETGVVQDSIAPFLYEARITDVERATDSHGKLFFFEITAVTHAEV
jgi:hypothetical protein